MQHYKMDTFPRQLRRNEDTHTHTHTHRPVRLHSPDKKTHPALFLLFWLSIRNNQTRDLLSVSILSVLGRLVCGAFFSGPLFICFSTSSPLLSS